MSGSGWGLRLHRSPKISPRSANVAWRLTSQKINAVVSAPTSSTADFRDPGQNICTSRGGFLNGFFARSQGGLVILCGTPFTIFAQWKQASQAMKSKDNNNRNGWEPGTGGDRSRVSDRQPHSQQRGHIWSHCCIAGIEAGRDLDLDPKMKSCCSVLLLPRSATGPREGGGGKGVFAPRI